MSNDPIGAAILRLSHPPSLSLFYHSSSSPKFFFLRFFLRRNPVFPVRRASRIERFWGNKATRSLFRSCSREHVWCVPSSPSYRGEVSFPGFCPRFHRLDIRVEGNILAFERFAPNFWIAICVLCLLHGSCMIWIFWIFSSFNCDY